MSHIIINSRVNFDLIHSNFKGRIIKSTLNGGCIYNFKESFQNVSKDAILINTVTVESELSQNYFIELFKNSENNYETISYDRPKEQNFMHKEVPSNNSQNNSGS